MKYFRRRNVLAVLSVLMCLQGAGAIRAAEENVASVETGGAVSVDVRAPVEQGSFTDENGTTYEWAGYSDGTAAVTGYVFSEEGPVIAVPDSLGGYRVIRRSGCGAV